MSQSQKRQTKKAKRVARGNKKEKKKKIGAEGGTIGQARLAKNKDVLAAAERIGVEGNGLEVDLRVLARGLSRAGAIVIPDGQLIHALHLMVKGLGLAAEVHAGAADPHVLSHYLVALGERHVVAEHFRVEES
jgi:hypothetical protein